MIDTLWQLLEVVVNFYQGIIISDYVYSILGDRKKRSFFKMTRPPKVRPKKSNFGGRYFYVKIQL